MDQRARAILEVFVVQVQRRLPGLAAEVFTTGSALTDDWRPAHSDVDAVFLVRRVVTADDADVLADVHAATRGATCVDGVYLTMEQLVAGPDWLDAAPQAVDGMFTLDKPGGQLNGVTWLELSRAPVARVDDDGAVVWREPQPLATDHACWRRA